jgi:hypothetical protein
MNSYLDKCFELYEKGNTVREIIENIYINYSSLIENDKIFEYKKIISREFEVSLKDIKLIGSSHTYFSTKSGCLKTKEEANDYDFAIINASLFNKLWSIVNDKQDTIYNKKMFYKYLVMGKFHPLYLDKDSALFKKIKSLLNEINTNSEKKSSVCIYAFEDAFIKNLCDYLTINFTDYFKAKKSSSAIKEVESTIKTLKDLGDKLNG